LVKHCTVEDHPKIFEINDDLINRVPYNIVAKKYGLGYYCVRRHALNHLQTWVKRQQAKYLQEERVKQTLTTTLAKIDELLTGSDSNLIEQMTMKDFISLLRLRSELLDEKKAAPRLEIVWGAGLEDEDKAKEEAFKVKINPVMKEKEADRDEQTEKVD